MSSIWASLHFRGVPGVFLDNFFVPNPDLKPETTSTLETGLRTRCHDLLTERGRLRLEAVFFNTDAEHFIDLELDIVAGTSCPDNIQDAELKGFETSRSRVPAGYGACDLYVSWLPDGAGCSVLRLDFGIGNLTDKAYRRHLSLSQTPPSRPRAGSSS